MSELRALEAGGPLRHYRIAGHVFGCDLRTPSLDSFAFDGAATVSATGGSSKEDFPALVFGGRTLVAGMERQIDCRWGESGCRLSVSDVGVFVIDPDGVSIRVREEGGAQEALFEILVGPALIIAMAIRGTFCLHASAIALNDRAIVFMGRSGAGKSTLAARVPAAAEHWRRVADDVLPVLSGEEGHAVCRGDFPQLSLSEKEQPALLSPLLPVSDFYVLQPPPPPDTDEIVIRELTRAEAAVALISQGVATSLFSEALLAEHFGFYATLAQSSRVCELGVPWSEAAVSRLASLL